MVIYFSGTGNSRYAAKLLAEKLNDKVVNAGLEIKENRKGTLFSDKPWVFVAPVYGWRIPRIFEEWIQKSQFSGEGKAYFVLTCGSDAGAAGRRLRRLCQALKLEYCGILPVVMPENYIAMFNATGQEESKALIAAANPVLESAAQYILKGASFATERNGVMDRIKTDVTNPLFYRLLVKAKPFHTTDGCTGCGKCVKGCPLNNITLIGGRPRWGRQCTHCMACICYCGKEAIEYGKATLGKRRYRCPEYKQMEYKPE